MNKFVYYILFCLCIIVPQEGFTESANSAETSSSSGDISVSGDAWAWNSPDLVRITLLVQSSGKTATEAMAGVKAKAERLSTALKKLNEQIRIETRDLRFTGADKVAVITANTAITAQQFIGVETTDLSLNSQIIDASLSSGAEAVVEIAYSVKDDNAARQEAIARATARAKGKAESLAASLGVQLGELISVAVVEEPVAKTQRIQQQQGLNLGNYSDEDLHIFVDLRFGIK